MGTMMDKSVEQLNAFLRGEISAVETYRQALGAMKDLTARSVVEQGLQDHQQRVSLLRDRIMSMGGEPVASSGVWGTFAKLIQGGASTLGEKPAIMALEEGEDQGIKNYKDDVSDLDADSRLFVQNELLPGQLRTHRLISDLKHNRTAGVGVGPRPAPSR